jgi:hypothetical protein
VVQQQRPSLDQGAAVLEHRFELGVATHELCLGRLVVGAFRVGHPQQGRPIAPSVDDRKAAATAMDAHGFGRRSRG